LLYALMLLYYNISYIIKVSILGRYEQNVDSVMKMRGEGSKF